MLRDDPPAMLGDERVSGGAMLAQCLSREVPKPRNVRGQHLIGARERCCCRCRAAETE
jgi:hypothetical protein